MVILKIQKGNTKDEKDNWRNMVAALWQLGGKVRYREYPGVDHNCWTPTYADQDVLKWFFEQRRPICEKD